MVGVETAVNTFTTGEQGLPAVTALSDGGWLVAWTSYDGQDGDGSGICQQRYHADGSVFGGETKVNTYTTSTQEFAQTAAFADGGWVVTWDSDGQDGSETGVYQQRYDADGAAAGTETLVNLFTTDYQFSRGLTALDDGSWVVSWTSEGQDGSARGVYQRHYAPD